MNYQPYHFFESCTLSNIYFNNVVTERLICLAKNILKIYPSETFSEILQIFSIENQIDGGEIRRFATTPHRQLCLKFSDSFVDSAALYEFK
jgi:hypothetical protein